MSVSEDDCTGGGADQRRCRRLWTRSGAARRSSGVHRARGRVGPRAKAPRGAQRVVLQRSVLLKGRHPRVPQQLTHEDAPFQNSTR